MMNVDYDSKEDILIFRFNKEAIKKDISFGWNINVGMTAHGIGQISILDAKADGFLPIKFPQKLARITNRRVA